MSFLAALALSGAFARRDETLLRIDPSSGRLGYMMEATIHEKGYARITRVGYDERVFAHGNDIEFRRVVTTQSFDEDEFEDNRTHVVFAGRMGVGVTSRLRTNRFGVPLEKSHPARDFFSPLFLPESALESGTTWTLAGSAPSALTATYRKEMSVGRTTAILAAVAGPNIDPNGYVLIARNDGRLLSLVIRFSIPGAAETPHIDLEWRRNDVEGLLATMAELRRLGLPAAETKPQRERLTSNSARSLHRTLRQVRSLVDRLAI